MPSACNEDRTPVDHRQGGPSHQCVLWPMGGAPEMLTNDYLRYYRIQRVGKSAVRT